MEQKVNYVHTRFTENSIQVDEEWLSGYIAVRIFLSNKICLTFYLFSCVDYFISEDSNISNGNLYERALEQFRLSDICEIGLRSLPIVNSEPTELKGQYVVQIQFLVDICK